MPLRQTAFQAIVLLAVAWSTISSLLVYPHSLSYFNELACQDAVRSGGYYWGGSWYPMMYRYPYPYYYDSYRSYVSRGGVVRTAPPGSYGRPGGSVSTPRGGFGSTGAGHSSGGGE